MYEYPHAYEAIVVGGGHAGCEAAHALARLGKRTLLLTMNIDTIGHMSCNPAIGGVAKGHIVREIDALGGIMGRVADKAGIHYKVLNRSKGPAVRSSRAQMDMMVYRHEMQALMLQTENLDVKQGSVQRLLLSDDPTPEVRGVVDQLGIAYRAPAVILTTGTFLRGLCHVGLQNFAGGRAGDKASMGLSDQLMALELTIGRLKTGTTPRLDARSINWDILDKDAGDKVPRPFSFYGEGPQLPQVDCYVTYTNARTHDIIRGGFDRSPMFSGAIEGKGPRYCPSIEDKVNRFEDRDRHLIFLEPQGLNTTEVYPNGISTSLPFDVQLQMVRSIEGLENAEIIRPGYAVEYDFVDPIQLHPSLELRAMPGLFLAGQINGTSGYEEAGAQGLMAGINVARKLDGEDALVLRRDQAYIGVLIDDLTSRGTKEPYRMFTSRAEFRLLLREDNADRRLSPLGHEVGLLSSEDFAVFEKRAADFDRVWSLMDKSIGPNQTNKERMEAAGLGPLNKKVTLGSILSRPGAKFAQLHTLLPDEGLDQIEELVAEALEVEVCYSGYLDRQRAQAEALRKADQVLLPADFDYDAVPGLSNEVREKLKAVAPANLGQAERIQGVTPAALTNLWMWLKRAQAAASRMEKGSASAAGERK